MRSYYDMQVEEKKRLSEFEKTLDVEQARIWKIDTDKYYEQEREINDKVKYFLRKIFVLNILSIIFE